jgi:hypothetical protein
MPTSTRPSSRGRRPAPSSNDRITASAAIDLLTDSGRREAALTPRDTENVYRTVSSASLVRGPVHPINVIEPVLWIVRQLARVVLGRLGVSDPSDTYTTVLPEVARAAAEATAKLMAFDKPPTKEPTRSPRPGKPDTRKRKDLGILPGQNG